MEEKFISVTVLNSYISGIFVAEEMLHGISVCGEVSGLSTRGGHAYFTLKDENAQIQCCCFRYAKTYLPRDGETVLAKGSVGYYAKGGRLSFNIDAIRPIGEGLAALRLAQLRQRLAEEGYFDESRKKPIPACCGRVCVLTSASGAVIRDIVTTVRRKNEVIDIVLRDVPVQGAACADAIVKELSLVDKLGYDAIIIARGGGSAEDLMPFNEEKIVKAVYAANTPVISAVGHETDYTLCDLAADVRAATPTAAAQLIAYDVKELLGELDKRTIRMYGLLGERTDRYRLRFENTTNKLLSAIRLNYYNLTKKLELSSHKMAISVQNRIKDGENAVSGVLTRLSDINPANILAKGYFTATKDGGRIPGISALSAGDRITLTGGDGSADAEIKEVRKA